MESHEAGTLAGAGSFRCESCGFAIALRHRDEVPRCPNCGGETFERAPMFGGAIPVAPLHADEKAPEWLRAAREALVTAGDYLAFDIDDRVQVVPLEDGWTRIGRSLSAHIRLDDPTVSRRHALVYRSDDGAKVLDDRSLNGVFHNGSPVELAQLEDDDTIWVGRFCLHFISVSGRGGQETKPAPATGAVH
jgi:FHA domain/Zinc-ribbon containing domain